MPVSEEEFQSLHKGVGRSMRDPSSYPEPKSHSRERKHYYQDIIWRLDVGESIDLPMDTTTRGYSAFPEYRALMIALKSRRTRRKYMAQGRFKPNRVRVWRIK
jgi:hypothetical protein